MASSRRSERRPRRLRCAYRESGRQCVRDGEGNPPLCSVHRVVFAEVGKPPARRSAVVEVFDDLLAGRKITRDRFTDALDEAAGFVMGGGMAQGYHPDIDAQGNTRHDRSGARSNVRWWEVFREAAGRARQGPDPEQQMHEHNLAARRRARVVMGFAESEPVTVAAVGDRRKTLARKFHPDLGPPEQKNTRTERMMEINAAADILLAELEDA